VVTLAVIALAATVPLFPWHSDKAQAWHPPRACRAGSVCRRRQHIDLFCSRRLFLLHWCQDKAERRKQLVAGVGRVGALEGGGGGVVRPARVMQNHCTTECDRECATEPARMSCWHVNREAATSSLLLPGRSRWSWFFVAALFCTCLSNPWGTSFPHCGKLAATSQAACSSQGAAPVCLLASVPQQVDSAGCWRTFSHVIISSDNHNRTVGLRCLRGGPPVQSGGILMANGSCAAGTSGAADAELNRPLLGQLSRHSKRRWYASACGLVCVLAAPSGCVLAGLSVSPTATRLLVFAVWTPCDWWHSDVVP
jgi:hypothetical protein